MKWEFRVIEPAQEQSLNELGQTGWFLVCVDNGTAYMSRQVVDEVAAIQFVEKRDAEVGEHCCAGRGCSC